jgi:hypothetical protein
MIRAIAVALQLSSVVLLALNGYPLIAAVLGVLWIAIDHETWR